MSTVRRRGPRKRRGGGLGPAVILPSKLRKKQKGGIIPLAVAIPALIAAGKAAALGAAGGAASYGGKKAMKPYLRRNVNVKRLFDNGAS